MRGSATKIVQAAALIHQVADKEGSRKLISSLADPYALGPGLRPESRPLRYCKPTQYVAGLYRYAGID